MKIYNADKTEILTNADLEKGHLKKDVLIRHIDYVAPVEEQGHYETIREYPNGGKDVEWVVDVEGVAEVQEHDEQEDILVYIPYTEIELAKIAKECEIQALKDALTESDYKALKYIDGLYTEEDYAVIKAERQSYRDKINALEEELASLAKF